jgi:signal transduction histidine kinase
MGLGLWLCQHIISRHGGYIRYEDATGGGAQFVIFLPSAHWSTISPRANCPKVVISLHS